MTERWQRELKKLGGVQMPPSVGPRIEDGPTGDRLPARRQRIVAGVLAFAVFGAAGAFAFQALRNREPSGGLGSGGVVVELRSAADMPEARLTFDGVPWKPQLGSTCWGGSGTGHCFDTVSPTFAAKDALPMQYGTEVRVIGDATTVTASLLPADADPYSADPSLFIHLGSLPVRLSAPPGDYFLIVRGTWQQGSEDFYFSITIKPPSPAGGTGQAVVTLRAPPGQPPTATLSFNGITRQALRGRACWMQVGVSGGDCPDTLPGAFTKEDYVVVPYGTNLRAVGDAPAVDASIFYWNPGPSVSQVVPSEGRLQDLGRLRRPPSLSLRPGNYILVLAGRWPSRSAEFFLPITILPA